MALIDADNWTVGDTAEGEHWARGCDRTAVMAVLDVSRRSAFHKDKRGRAYEFPLEAIDRRGGRPQAKQRDEERSAAVTDAAPGESDEQQRLDAVAEQDPESLGRTETWGTPEPDSETRSSDGSVEDSDQAVSENGTDDDLRMHLQYAIDALQEWNKRCSNRPGSSGGFERLRSV